MKEILYKILTLAASIMGRFVGTTIKFIDNIYSLSRDTLIIAFPYIIVSLSVALGVHLLLGYSFLGVFFLLVGVLTLTDLKRGN